jgi:peptide/nickel transport system substrate-binding protein
MLGLLSYLSGMQDVEKVDDYTIRLNLKEPNIGVPEHLFHYPAIVLHRDFQGDFIKQPVGTGAFTLEEFSDAERAVLKRRTDYWEMGEDGQPLPYLDEVIYVAIDKDAGVAAMQSGQVDSLQAPRPGDFLALKDIEGITARSAGTAQCYVIRMRVDLEPWNNEKVRNALKMCQDREKILQLSYFGEGDLSIDAHVAPVHPAYCEKPIPKYDPEGAKALLAEAGFPDGLKVTLATKNDEAEPDIAQALKELAAAGGFDITLDVTEPDGYWDRWTEVDLGITAWTHRPLDTMVLPLAYIADAAGAPVPWNETRWVDEEFTKVLREAEGTLDIEARRELMCKIEDIMQGRGPIGNSYWKNVWNITRTEFQNVEAHPTGYDLLNNVWKDA